MLAVPNGTLNSRSSGRSSGRDNISLQSFGDDWDSDRSNRLSKTLPRNFEPKPLEPVTPPSE